MGIACSIFVFGLVLVAYKEIKSRRNQETDEYLCPNYPERLPWSKSRDKAFALKADAERAIKDRLLNEAWEMLADAKTSIIEACAQGFVEDKSTALWVDSGFHEPMANILRLEGRHYAAFVHICYWVAAGQRKPLKKHENKLRVYFNRCDYSETTLEDVRAYLLSIKNDPQFERINVHSRNWA